MSKRFLPCAAFLGLLLSFNACKKAELVTEIPGVSLETLAKIKALGFSNENVAQTDGGYIVEGDIFLSDEDLNAKYFWQTLVLGQEEQYHTTNLVTGLPRQIKISISNQLPSSYVAALDEAISRYNAEGLSLTFSRVNNGANISITKAPRLAGYLASAGFPTSTGNPHNSIKVNSTYLGAGNGSTTFRNYIATILAHEIGHCIGFRHTDYMERQYSCGGSPYNEGASTVGAIYIPGTASGPDPNSWMLACIGANQNRPFNNNDKTALGYLY